MQDIKKRLMNIFLRPQKISKIWHLEQEFLLVKNTFNVLNKKVIINHAFNSVTGHSGQWPMSVDASWPKTGSGSFLGLPDRKKWRNC